MSIIKKIWRGRHFVFSLPTTLWFNFKNFPIKKAIHLPVFLYKASVSGHGKFILPDKIYPGIIRLGFPMVSVFRDKGIVIENKGRIIFEGETILGGGSGISVGEHGTLTFGDKFCNQSGGKIICYHNISFGKTVRLGWQTVVCDTDFHTMKSEDGNSYTKGYGKISIGDDVWVGSFCKFFKNTSIPSKCTVASNSVISKIIDCRPYSLIYPGGGIKIKYTGYCRDISDDKVDYEIKKTHPNNGN